MKNIKKNKIATNNLKSGFVALFSIVIIGAVVLIMAYTSSVLGLGELDLAYTSQKGNEALVLGDGCLEESLRRIRLDTGYTGENLTISNGSCIINVSINGNNRTIVITADTTNNFYKKIETNITLSADAIPIITIDSWEEKSD